jgi:hypothetical protein
MTHGGISEKGESFDEGGTEENKESMFAFSAESAVAVKAGEKGPEPVAANGQSARGVQAEGDKGQNKDSPPIVAKGWLGGSMLGAFRSSSLRGAGGKRGESAGNSPRPPKSAGNSPRPPKNARDSP